MSTQQRLGDRPSLREMYPRVQVHNARRRAVAPFDSCPTRRSPHIPPPHFLSDGLDTGPHQTEGSDLGNGELHKWSDTVALTYNSDSVTNRVMYLVHPEGAHSQMPEGALPPRSAAVRPGARRTSHPLISSVVG